MDSFTLNKMHSTTCLIFISAAIVSSVCEPAIQRLEDLSIDAVQDLLTIIINGTVHELGNCPESNNLAPLTEYWIFTRDSPNDPQIVNQPNLNFTSKRSKIIFIVHGWLRSPKSVTIAGIKNAYLIKYNAIVVSVNWSAYTNQGYYSTYCAAQGVANNVADFMCTLKQDLNISLEGIHAVGHSVGAHILGIAGSAVYKRCGEKIGRITGLDPAGPLYIGIDPDNRLDPSDALFVDVIHTTVGQAGYIGSCGHIDSYPNCGLYQPGCLKLVFERDVVDNITAILLFPVDLVTCSHERSCNFFQESILADTIVARQCIDCNLPVCFPNILSSERKIIGEGCTTPGEVQNYVFYTHSSPPFTEG